MTVRILNESNEVYAWESDPGDLSVGTFMDNRITFDQFMFAMAIDDPADVKNIRERCAVMKKEFEAELKEPVGIVIYVTVKDEGFEVTIGTSFIDS